MTTREEELEKTLKKRKMYLKKMKGEIEEEGEGKMRELVIELEKKANFDGISAKSYPNIKEYSSLLACLKKVLQTNSNLSVSSCFSSMDAFCKASLAKKM